MFEAVQQRGGDDEVEKKKKAFLNSENGKLMTELVSEYLQCAGLEYSKKVFDAESGVEEESSRPDREQLAEDLGVDSGTGEAPLLAAVLNVGTGRQNESLRQTVGSKAKQPRMTSKVESFSTASGSFTDGKKEVQSNVIVSDEEDTGDIATDVEIDYDDGSNLGDTLSGPLGVSSMSLDLPVGEASDLYGDNDRSGSIDGLEDTVDLVENARR